MTLVLLAVVAAAGGGCTRKSDPTLEEMPELTTQPATGPAYRDVEIPLLDLVARSESLQASGRRMPGQTADEHRRLMHAAFEDLSQILPQLVGPEPAGTYRQQLRAVDNARERLSSESDGLAPEPTIDAGLRAAYGVLSTLHRESYSDQQDLARTLEELKKRVDHLDTVSGAVHRAEAGESVELAGDAVRQIVAALAERLGEPGAATAPAAGG